MKRPPQNLSPVKHNQTKLHLIIGAAVLIVLVITASFVIQNNVQQDVRIRAAGPVCNPQCVTEPSCCKDIRDQNDPYACGDYIERYFCNRTTCAPFDGSGSHCGWYWNFHNANDNEYHIGTNTPEGYGCMIGPDDSSMRPICSGGGTKPSNTPRPTQPRASNTPKPPKPTNSPKPTGTGAPAASPTNSFTIPSDNSHLQPTNPVFVQPTQPDDNNPIYPTHANYPTQSPDFIERSIIQVQMSPTSAPKFQIPIFDIKEKINNSFQSIKDTVVTFFITILP